MLLASSFGLQVEKSVADLGRHGFTLRTLLTPKAARAAEHQAREQALHSQDSDRFKQQLELQAGLEGCGFNPAQLQGVMALDDIEEIVAQVRVPPDEDPWFSSCGGYGEGRRHSRTPCPLERVHDDMAWQQE